MLHAKCGNLEQALQTTEASVLTRMTAFVESRSKEMARMFKEVEERSLERDNDNRCACVAFVMLYRDFCHEFWSPTPSQHQHCLRPVH